MLSARRVCSNRHSLDKEIWRMFHDEPVLECSRFPFIRVADEISLFIRRHTLPLSGGFEPCASPPPQPSLPDRFDNLLRSHCQRSSQTGKSSARAILSEIQRVGRVRVARNELCTTHFSSPDNSSMSSSTSCTLRPLTNWSSTIMFGEVLHAPRQLTTSRVSF